MANVAPGHFAGSFLSAFTAAQQARDERERNKKEIDAKMKLFEIQLQREQQANAAGAAQQGAQAQIQERLTGSSPLASGGQLLSPQPPMSLTDLLADPQNAALMLKSGYLKGEDLLNFNEQQPGNVAKRMSAMVTALGTPGAAPPGVPPGPAGAAPLTVSSMGATPPALPMNAPAVPAAPPGGFQVSGIKLDAQGHPMIDLSRPSIKQWIVSADGKQKLGIDDQGRVLASMPASPADRAPEDVPMAPADLLKFRDAQGRPPQPGITPRQIASGGYTPITSAQESTEDLRSSANAVMTKLDGLVDRIFTAGPGIGRAVQGSEHLYQSITQANPDVALYESFSKGTIAPLLRSLGEKGSLSEGDVQRALNLLPKTFPVPDSREVAMGKLEQLREIIKAGATPGGTERGASKPTATTTLPRGIPTGSRQIGTSGGKPVYETANGKRLIVE